MRETSHHPGLIHKEEKEEKDDSDDQQFSVHFVGSLACFLDPQIFVGFMGSSPSVPHSSVNLLIDGKVSRSAGRGGTIHRTSGRLDLVS